MLASMAEREKNRRESVNEESLIYGIISYQSGIWSTDTVA